MMLVYKISEQIIVFACETKFMIGAAMIPDVSKFLLCTKRRLRAAAEVPPSPLRHFSNVYGSYGIIGIVSKEAAGLRGVLSVQLFQLVNRVLQLAFRDIVVLLSLQTGDITLSLSRYLAFSGYFQLSASEYIPSISELEYVTVI